MTERAYSDHERMTPAELKVVREYLGLSGTALARLLQVSDRTVRHWEEGKYPIPDGVRQEVEKLEKITTDFVNAVIAQLMDCPGDPVVVTFRTDAEYRAAHPGSPLTASWHRAAIARVAQHVPELSIVYASDIPKTAQPKP